MITRRSLLVGSTAVLGTLGVARSAAAASGHPLTAALPAGAVSGFSLPGGLTCPVPFMSRSAWGANESLRSTNNGGYWPEEYYPVQALTVHHTGFVTDPDPTVTVRLIYTRQTLYGDGSVGAIGWGDIGYHLLIDDQGVVYEGRYSGSDQFPIFDPTGAVVTGAHVLHYNTGNIGVCLLGFLDGAPATQAAQDSLVTVLAYLAAVGRVNPTGAVKYVNQAPGYAAYTKNVKGINGHRDWAATDCPGSAFYPLLTGIRTAVAAAMPTPPPAPSPSSTVPATPSPTTSPTVGSSPPATPAPSQTSIPSPTPHPSTTPKTGGRDRGGDEYVARARKASPSAYPTKRPSPTPSAAPSAAPSFPMSTPAPSWEPASGAVPEVSGTGGPGWGVGATVAGVTAAGALGVWWLRQRRLAPASGATELSTIDVDSSPTDATAAQPSATDEPTETG